MEIEGIQRAADLVGVHYTLVHRWVQRGKVKARKHKGKWFVNRRSLMDWACPYGLTINQAVEYAGLPWGTVYELIKTNRLRKRMIRKTWYIDQGSLENYLEIRQELEENWITTDEARFIAGINKTSIKNWVKRELFETRYFDGRRWIKRDSFMAWLEVWPRRPK